jgi:Domain of unknown function (DUF1833)
MPISETARRAAYARTTSEVMVDLITFEHEDLVDPLRFANNTSSITSRGDLYVAAPFRAMLPSQVDAGDPVVTIEVQNVDRVLEEALAGLTSEPDVTVECVYASSPDDVVLGPYKLPLRSSETSMNTIRLTLGGSDPLLSKTFPRARFNQADWPGLAAG